MPLAVSITSIIENSQGILVSGNLAATGNYVTGGDVANFTSYTQDPAYIGAAAFLNSSQPPQSFDVWDASGNIANELFAVTGTTLANCKLKITSAFNTELAAAPYPAGLTVAGGAKLQFSLVLAKNV